MSYQQRPASLKDYNLLFFDCETGGLDPRENDILQMAAILTDPSGTKVLDEYEAKVFPKKAVHPKAAEVNGYTQEKWAAAGAVDIDIPLVKILQMGRNAIFTAHNAAFDWAFFETAFKSRGARWQSDYHRYDTVAMALPLLRHGLVPSLKLTTLSAYFGIEHTKAHDALADVRACRDVYVKLQSVFDQEAVVNALRALKKQETSDVG